MSDRTSLAALLLDRRTWNLVREKSQSEHRLYRYDLESLHTYDGEDKGHSGEFSIVLNVRQYDFRKSGDVTIIVSDRTIVGACACAFVRRSGDFDDQVQLTHLRQFESIDLTVERIESIIPNRLVVHAEHYLSRGGRLPPATSREIERAMSEVSPDSDTIFADLRQLVRRVPATYAGKQVVIQEQRDALATTLEATGFDSRELLDDRELNSQDEVSLLRAILRNSESGITPDAGEPPAARPQSARALTAREDSILRHDATVMDDWVPCPGEKFDQHIFHDPLDPKRSMTAWYVDKTPLEEITGTDLIYFRKSQPGYVMVQYKRMVDGKYRPDRQMDVEIRRMHGLLVGQGDLCSGVDDFRMLASPFYIKLVESDLRRPEGNRLARGMYFPLPLFEFLLEDERIRGPRGGKTITWENASRYLTNTEFLDLLKGGWIGSTEDRAVQIDSHIRASLDARRGVVVARDNSTHFRQHSGWRNR